MDFNTTATNTNNKNQSKEDYWQFMQETHLTYINTAGG